MLCKECIKDAQQYIPEFLDIIINKNLKCIKEILTPNNQIPLFNGGAESNLEYFHKLLDDLDYKPKNKKIIGGIHSFNIRNNAIFFDAGEPPKKIFLKATNLDHYHSSIIWMEKKLSQTVDLVQIYPLKPNF